MKDHVPNLFPATDPGEARLAFVGEAPALAEVSWSTCREGHQPSWKKVAPRIVELASRCATAAPLGTEVDLEIPF